MRNVQYSNLHECLFSKHSLWFNLGDLFSIDNVQTFRFIVIKYFLYAFLHFWRINRVLRFTEPCQAGNRHSILYQQQYSKCAIVIKRTNFTIIIKFFDYFTFICSLWAKAFQYVKPMVNDKMGKR